eukprot:1044726-Heterocapsa_arctica.AAC.1
MLGTGRHFRVTEGPSSVLLSSGVPQEGDTLFIGIGPRGSTSSGVAELVPSALAPNPKWRLGVAVGPRASCL